MSDEIKKCEECGETEGRIVNSDRFERILCMRHYNQMHRHGEIRPDKPNEEKKCDECGKTEGKIFNSDKYKRTLCYRHYNQMNRHGKIFERTRADKNDIIEDGEISYIVLRNMKQEEVARAIVDAEDVSKISKYKWAYVSAGYVRTTHKGRSLDLHRMVMNYTGKLEIDHINRNKLDSRKENLRIVTHQENMMNTGMYANNKSGVIGVFYDDTDNKWIMSLNVNKKRHRKYFKTKEEAIRERLLLEKEHYGNNAKQAHLFKEYNIA